MSSSDLFDAVTGLPISACDSLEMLELEDDCYMMGPLIDKQLQFIDFKHAILEDLNLKVLESFQMYNNLMKESLTKTANLNMPMSQIDSQKQLDITTFQMSGPINQTNLSFQSNQQSIAMNEYLKQFSNQTGLLSSIPSVPPAASQIPFEQNKTFANSYSNNLNLQPINEGNLPIIFGSRSTVGATYSNISDQQTLMAQNQFHSNNPIQNSETLLSHNLPVSSNLSIPNLHLQSSNPIHNPQI